MTEAMQESQAVKITASVASTMGSSSVDWHTYLESGRLPILSDVLSCVDMQPEGVAVAAIVEHLLGKRDDQERYAKEVRDAFSCRVNEIVRALIAGREVEWVPRPPGAIFHLPTIRRHVDLLAIGDVAIACGNDPEQAMAHAEPKHVPRYRTCAFWRADGKSDGSRDWPAGTIVLAIVGPNYKLEFYVSPTPDEAAMVLASDRIAPIPEHVARRLEQGGWTPYWADMPPAWASVSPAIVAPESSTTAAT